uniref:Uncharacterized protein n=1 Tax=Acinetobacter nosocomialis TaxID=106654 RepID=A0A7S9H9I4_ACINO|nr:hypothetical protein WM98B_00132 [Acinetobacter nosocomialis]
MAEVAPHTLQYNAACQGFAQHLVDEGLIVGGELSQRLRQVIGNGELGGDGAGKPVFVRLGIEGLAQQCHRRGGRCQPHVVAGQCGDGQAKLVGQRADAISTLIRLAAFEGAVTMHRDWPGDGVVRSEALPLEFGIEFVIEQAPEQHHGFAGHVGLHLVSRAVDGDTGIDTDLAPLGFAGEAAELLPGAHLAQALGWQVGQPVLDPRMRFGTMLLGVVGAHQVTQQPLVGLGLGFRLMEVIQRLVSLLHRAEWSLHLAFRAGRGAGAILAGRNVRLPFDTQRRHDVLEDPALGHRAVVQVDHFGAALEGKGRVGLRCHGVEQEAQSRLGIFAIHTVVFLVGHSAAVVHYAEQHQRRLAPGRVDPVRLVDVFEVGGRQVELPTVVAVCRLKTRGGRLPQQS